MTCHRRPVGLLLQYKTWRYSFAVEDVAVLCYGRHGSLFMSQKTWRSPSATEDLEVIFCQRRHGDIFLPQKTLRSSVKEDLQVFFCHRRPGGLLLQNIWKSFYIIEETEVFFCHRQPGGLLLELSFCQRGLLLEIYELSFDKRQADLLQLKTRMPSSIENQKVFFDRRPVGSRLSQKTLRFSGIEDLEVIFPDGFCLETWKQFSIKFCCFLFYC